MKSNQKITRVQLKINHDDELIVLGLVSSEPDYKMSLSINKTFRISLKNINPVKLNNSANEALSFSRFSDLSHSPEMIFSLVSNRSGKNFLIKNLRNIDFIFIAHNNENNNNIEEITARLREIEAVDAVFNIDLNIFKDKNLHYLTQ
jgi:hypothetical protein